MDGGSERANNHNTPPVGLSVRCSGSYPYQYLQTFGTARFIPDEGFYVDWTIVHIPTNNLLGQALLQYLFTLRPTSILILINKFNINSPKNINKQYVFNK